MFQGRREIKAWRAWGMFEGQPVALWCRLFSMYRISFKGILVNLSYSRQAKLRLPLTYDRCKAARNRYDHRKCLIVLITKQCHAFILRPSHCCRWTILAKCLALTEPAVKQVIAYNSCTATKHLRGAKIALLWLPSKAWIYTQLLYIESLMEYSWRLINTVLQNVTKYQE